MAGASPGWSASFLEKARGSRDSAWGSKEQLEEPVSAPADGMIRPMMVHQRRHSTGRTPEGSTRTLGDKPQTTQLSSSSSIWGNHTKQSLDNDRELTFKLAQAPTFSRRHSTGRTPRNSQRTLGDSTTVAGSPWQMPEWEDNDQSRAGGTGEQQLGPSLRRSHSTGVSGTGRTPTLGRRTLQTSASFAMPGSGGGVKQTTDHNVATPLIIGGGVLSGARASHAFGPSLLGIDNDPQVDQTTLLQRERSRLSAEVNRLEQRRQSLQAAELALQRRESATGGKSSPVRSMASRSSPPAGVGTLDTLSELVGALPTTHPDQLGGAGSAYAMGGGGVGVGGGLHQGGPLGQRQQQQHQYHQPFAQQGAQKYINSYPGVATAYEQGGLAQPQQMVQLPQVPVLPEGQRVLAQAPEGMMPCMMMFNSPDGQPVYQMVYAPASAAGQMAVAGGQGGFFNMQPGPGGAAPASTGKRRRRRSRRSKSNRSQQTGGNSNLQQPQQQQQQQQQAAGNGNGGVGPADKRLIYVDYLPPNSTIGAVRELFSVFGTVTDVRPTASLSEAGESDVYLQYENGEEVPDDLIVKCVMLQFEQQGSVRRAVRRVTAYNRQFRLPGRSSTYQGAMDAPHHHPQGGKGAAFDPTWGDLSAFRNVHVLKKFAYDKRLAKKPLRGDTQGSPARQPTNKAGSLAASPARPAAAAAAAASLSQSAPVPTHNTPATPARSAAAEILSASPQAVDGGAGAASVGPSASTSPAPAKTVVWPSA